MPTARRLLFLVALLALNCLPAAGNGPYWELRYPASATPGELKMEARYTLWLPANVRQVRAVIVHQHGCGLPAATGGATAAHDLHWQALATKWQAALLAPSYQQPSDDVCRDWFDPRNGSDRVFQRALADFAAQTKHPELATAPWVLWGHSGGGIWAGLMTKLHPERVAVAWLRSGAPVQEADLPAALYRIPMMTSAGAKEEHDRFAQAYANALAWFQRLRAQGAPVAFAPDPRTSHENGDGRYLAIPYFDALLAQRLPDKPAQPLRAVAGKSSWLAPLLTAKAVPAARFEGDRNTANWFPNERLAQAWMEFVRTGAVSDTTPPPAPVNVKAARSAAGVELTWTAAADFESGLQAFVVERDGQVLAQVPEKPVGRYGRPLFQAMSYHDTPTTPLPALQYTDTTAGPGAHRYRVIAINSVGLRSRPSAAVRTRPAR